MKVVTGKVMSCIDRQASGDCAIPGLLLMEDAGQNAWRSFRTLCREKIDKESKLLFVAGKGNNGGDALVMARAAFSEGFTGAKVVLFASENGESVRLHTKICEGYGLKVLCMEGDKLAVQAAISDADVIFDGIAGTGLKGALRPMAAELVRRINESRALKVAVDIPSGLGDDAFPIAGSVIVRADITLAMELPKLPLFSPEGRKLVGRIVVVPVGFPLGLIAEAEAAAEWFVPEEVQVPELAPWAYKNRRGHLLVIGGAPCTDGAPFLCAMSAASSGAGLVTLMLDDEIFARTPPDRSGIMIRRLDPKFAASVDSVVIGPGWGRNEARLAAFDVVVQHAASGVIDADGITLLGMWLNKNGGRLPGKDGSTRWIVTPHPGEASRLAVSLGLCRDIEEARSMLLTRPWELLPPMAERCNGVIVLKSHISHIASPEGGYEIVEGNNPALGTGGSGDVLAGICGTMLMRGEMAAREAALQAVALHQRAGKHAAEKKGFFTAGQLIEFIGIESYRSAAE
jgi:NAD(P)H-hydrate epimerase